ncbi:MAG: FecR domain-containing protein [Candidatus Omnitrophica bacterium]|nr:FecR domain-containing protein [Candidatus Omnitrophota bacterium]
MDKKTLKCRINNTLITGPFPGFIQVFFADILEKHIKKCPSCSKELGDLHKIDRILAGLLPIKESDRFDAEFKAKLEAELLRNKKPALLPGTAISFTDLTEFFKDLSELLTAPFAPAFRKIVVTFSVSLVAVFAGLNFYGNDEPSVSEINGTAFILRNSANGWLKIDPGTKLKKGDEVRSAGTSELVIALPSKYNIKLRPGATIEVAMLTPRNRHGICRFNLKKGDMLVDIDKPFKGSKFEVETPNAKVRAIGTKFMVSQDKQNDRTWVGVLEGKVDVSSRKERLSLAKVPSKVVVDAGMKTEIPQGEAPLTPVPLLMEEWQKISDLFMLGKRTKVALLLSNDKNRVLELLSPCPIFIQDQIPRTIPVQLEEALYLINEANKNGDKAIHLDGIHKLEEIVKKDPKAEYSPKLLLFIGSYYSYIGEDIEAIRAFSVVFKLYSDSGLAPLAKTAIAYLKETRLFKKTEAKAIYLEIIHNYPASPESSFALDRLSSL